jgi:hypothetical protein
VLPGRWYKETLEPLGASARVVARFEDGSPAAITSAFGKGRTLLIGSYVSASAQSTPTAEAEKFFAGLLDWARVSRPVQVAGATFEVRTTESGADRLLFVFNHAKTTQSGDVTLRAAGVLSATDIVTGARLEVKTSSGAVTLPVTLDAGDVRVFKLSPERAGRQRNQFSQLETPTAAAPASNPQAAKR